MGFVLKLCGWYPSRIDALSGDFVQRQAIAIAQNVKTVVLFAQKDAAMKGAGFELVKRAEGNLYEYIYYYPQRRFADKLWSQWYYLQILKHFIKQLQAEHGEPAILHVNIVWRAAIWASLLHKRFGWPFLITENSTEYQDNALENIRHRSWSRKRITAGAFRHCRHFIPVSKQLGLKIRELYGEIPFSVVPNTVDISRFYYDAARTPGKKFELLHVSTMGYQKNIEGILRVLALFARKNIPFHITMAGPADDAVRRSVAANEALAAHVHFTGAIPYHEVAAITRAADCLLLFSRYENLPCVILESLCCGVPVISSNVGGIPEVIDDTNGLLVDEGDEEGLLAAITKMANHEITFDREQIAFNAGRLYSYETVSRAFINLYRELFPGRL